MRKDEVRRMRKIMFVRGCIFVFLILPSSFILFAQEPQWRNGKGSAEGTDTKQIRVDAINDARANAMKQAGIDIRANDVLVKTEANQQLTDFYSKFAETSTKGIILEERNLKVGEAKRVSENSDVYKIEVELEALVAPQNGEPDAGFEVTISTKKEVYIEEEPVEFTITSSRKGFVTIFNIHGDSLAVIFPNALDEHNAIAAHIPLLFPVNKAYSLTLETLPAKQNSQEEFIAVVTKENIPFQKMTDTMIDTRGVLKIKEAQLISFANWLYKIPIQTRASAKQIVTVQKKMK